MKARYLLIMMMFCLVSVLSAQATELLISEYVEGTSYQKAIEIFNGTGAPVDLAQYSLKKQVNGAGAFGNELVLSGTLANNDVYVIVNSSAGGTNLVGQPYVDLATTNGSINFNGNDAVALYHNGVQIDVVGIVDDPNIWGQDMTLVRNSDIASPTTVFDLAQWTAYPVNTFTYLGSHTFTGGSTDPIIIISYPNTAVTWYVGQTYTISWSSANLTGNVQIELNNNESYSQIVYDIENTGSYAWTIPETQDLGTQFKIKVSNIGVSVWDMSDEFFTIAQLPVVDVATIAALRASNADGTTVYRLTGEAVLTYQQTYRFKKYIQDATAAIEVDDPNAIITTVYQIGDGITNLLGYLSIYHNLMQFTPFANPGAASSTGNAIVPAVVTINELNTNFAPYQSQLVLIQNATFLDTSTPFATGIVYNISDGTGQIAFRTNFYEADYIDQPVPTGTLDMKVITSQYDETYQVTSRYLADFTPVANDDPENNLSPMILLGNYPNPFNPNTTIAFRVKSPQPIQIEIYNTKGQIIRTLKKDVKVSGDNNLIWNAKDENGRKVAAGLYLYNIKGGKFTSSKKMILLK
jgi:hypothetical protein